MIQTPRQTCSQCRRPVSFCYCALIQKINFPIIFVILIHPLEARRKIATGRMAHLCLSNSLLIQGDDFTHDVQVNQILQNPDYHCLLLYPGPGALDLSGASMAETKQFLFPIHQKTVIFVIDGTWSTARKTIRLSENLKTLPAIFFTPKSPSQFRVRKQPAPGCYSTIEAIHHILNLLHGSGQSDCDQRPHDLLLTVFHRMVEQQIDFIPKKMVSR